MYDAVAAQQQKIRDANRLGVEEQLKLGHIEIPLSEGNSSVSVTQKKSGK